MLAPATRLRTSAVLVVVALMSGPASAGLVFNFNPAAGTSQAAINGFTAASAYWSGLFDDNITVNIDIGFQSLDPGVLAQAGSATGFVAYEDVRNALIADATSVDDAASSSSIHVGQARMLINGLFDTPSDIYIDENGNDNNNYININSANAKAIGILPGDFAITDAGITFNSDFGFDFDRSDGISAGLFDFVGIAVHEIGHSLGFVSGVDILDYYAGFGFTDNDFPYVTPLDLFRYSALSTNYGAIDFTVGNQDKYFSVDGGVTKIASFSTGYWQGDGNQASHWKDDLGIGIMDPTMAPGELVNISLNDIRAMDVIGYNITAAAAVPEPGTLLSGAFAVVTTLVVARRRSTRAGA